ncbi:hypothetical protein THSYN_20040 [Candidatus Thiodictyon syntrophicum]|uniref:Uncharacterized protein n=2 Tax=Candidatus Thiodictyon syntrophicum TaxID=1166950 RepID=A0A2K8UBV5_9GAMM|nr:hypothetical protein THSYN_20040 [Candidatus Thiodictyon syntrophicum]
MPRFQYFSYISEYLSRSRESNIIAMLGVPMRDYIVMQRFFPAATKMSSGDWRLRYFKKPDLDESIAQKAIQMVTTLSLRAQEILGVKEEPEFAGAKDGGRS